MIAQQLALARLVPEPWRFSGGLCSVAGCFVCFPRGRTGPGTAGDVGWAAAVLMEGERLVATATVRGKAAWPYEPGLLALREGPLLEAAVRALPERPELLVVNATGRDHPRRAGLAVHLGFRLGIPTVGVTQRPLVARGDPPHASRGSVSPLWLDGEVVAYWVRTKEGTAPLVAHAGWRTDPQTAAEVLRSLTGRWRTPEPLRQARAAARAARAASPPLGEHE
ncbi:MAG: endonuclease V [Armatimonadota bacterium]|nr:endonuclease V [Armatimonadota bacterium]